jgi:hypothetical protein
MMSLPNDLFDRRLKMPRQSNNTSTTNSTPANYTSAFIIGYGLIGYYCIGYHPWIIGVSDIGEMI